MTRVTSLDGRVFDLDESSLKGREIARDRVMGLVDRDELPDAPPVGDMPVRGLPPQLLEKWQREGFDLPVPDEARGIVRARAFPDGRLVIDLNVPVGGGSPGPRGNPMGPMNRNDAEDRGSCGPATSGPASSGPASSGPASCGPASRG